MRVAVVVNRGGGAVAGQALSEENIERIFREAGITASVSMVDGSEVAQAVRSAVEQGIDAVAIGGGDGTISTAAGVLAGTGIPLGVLPLGTANHFAKDLGLPLPLSEAVAVIAQGRTRPLSLAEVNGHIFINNSLLGVYPELVRIRDKVRSKVRMNKILARWLAALFVLPSFPQVRVQFTLEGRTTSCMTPFVFIGTNAYEMHTFKFGARARTDDGRLFVYLARTHTRASLLRLFLKSLVKDVKQEKYFETWSVAQVSIETGHRSITVGADGELIKLSSPLLYRSLPGALQVFVPSEVDGLES